MNLAELGPRQHVDEWLSTGRKRGVVMVILTAVALSSNDPDMVLNQALRRPAQAWYGLAPLIK